MNYREVLEYIDSLKQYGSVLGLDNMRRLCEKLEHPERKCRFIHVAGTNGKGSTAAYIAHILMAAGCKVGRYISPTIFEYRERIQVIDKITASDAISDAAHNTVMSAPTSATYIPEEQVAKHLTLIKDTIETMTAENLPHPTPFEIETAMAFLCFKEAGSDIVLLETGISVFVVSDTSLEVVSVCFSISLFVVSLVVCSLFV